MHPFADSWNHTTHYYPRLLNRAPRTPATVLDVGCGDGRLANWAASLGHEVTGIDPELSDSSHSAARFVRARAEELPFADDTFDLVTMAMVLHLTDDAGRALAETKRVLRPGGRVAILGLGRDAGVVDRAWGAVDVATNAVLSRRYTELDLPRTDPSRSWAQERALVSAALPGVIWRRVPLWRYLAVWTKPKRAGL